MPPNLFVPIVSNNLKDFLERMDFVQNQGYNLELRLDYIRDLKLRDIQIIKEKLKAKAIATCRREDEGGLWSFGELERLRAIEKCIEFGFDFVDIELQTAIENKNYKLKKSSYVGDGSEVGGGSPSQKQKIILSHHNFQSTPDYSELQKIYDQMLVFGADIAKICCMPNDIKDLKTIAKFQKNNSKSKNLCLIGMGELGQMTRTFNLISGSPINFVLINGQESASGQLHISQIQEILHNL